MGIATNIKSKYKIKAMFSVALLLMNGVMLSEGVSARAVINFYNAGKADFASALYRQEYIDMQVKVRGRVLNIKRRWKDDHWAMLPDIANISFHYEQKYSDKKVIAGSNENVNTEPEQKNGLELAVIQRGDFKYKKVDGGVEGQTIYRFTPDSKEATRGFFSRKIITKTEQGYIWSDSQGNKIGYDVNGRAQYLDDINGNKIEILRDSHNRIEKFKDNTGEIVISIVYHQGTDTIQSISDYTGRVVEYIWDKDRIEKVKDVMGEYTQYEYTYYDIKTKNSNGIYVLSSETAPGNRQTSIMYEHTPAGYICVPDAGLVNPGNRSWRDKNGRYINNAAISYYDPKYGCKYKVSIEESLIMTHLIGTGGPNKSFDYFYDSNRKVYYHKVTYPDGMVEEKEINLNGEVTAKYINNIKVSKITRDGNKYISENEQGLRTIKEYDQWKNLTKIIYPDNTSKSFKYNAMGKISEKINEEGTITKYDYDPKGNLHKRTDAFGTQDQRTIEWCNQYTQLPECDTLKAAHCHGAPTNRCSIVKYHGGTIEGITIPDAVKVAIVDDKDNITKAYDAEGHLTKYQDFDALGNAKKTIDAENHEWLSTYDNAGNQLTSSTPRGNTVTYVYNKAGQLETVTDSVPNIGQNSFDIKYHYTSRGRVYLVEDSNGNFSRITHDSMGRVIEKKDAEGQIVKTTYDTFGRKTSVEDSSGNKITFNYKNDGTTPLRRAESIQYPTFSRHFKYDNRGRVAKVYNKIEDDQMLLIADIKYSKTGQRVSVTDANGKKTQYRYDKLGRVIKHIDADLKETNYVYDYTGNLLSIQDPESSKTQYRYDLDGRKKKEIRPMLGEYSYTYNDRGMLETFKDPKGNLTTYDYDQDGSLDIQKNFSHDDLETPKRTLNLDYYANGNLQAYSDGTISSSYTYNDSGALLSETINYPGFTKQYSYTYYDNGAKKTYTDAENNTYEYGYNQSGQLQSIRIPGVGNYSVTDYNFMSPKIELLPGGSKRTYDYTAQMQLKGINVIDPAQNPIMNYQYAYDNVGNIKTKTTEHGLYDYDYDNQYRLTNAINPNTATEEFTYDSVGNRLTTQENAEAWTYNANHELQARPQYSYGYDDNGSITAITKDNQTTTFVYNEANRLKEVKNNENQTIATYQYDPFGRRISKDVSGTKTYFLYTDRGLAGEYTATGQLIRGYGYKPYGHWTTDPLYLKDANNHYFYQNDHLGTPQKLTKTNGAIVWDARYESFGKAYVQANVIDNPLRFAGQYHDRETGLHYNWNRYYSNELGRYITEDPLGLSAGLNIYAYVDGDPINTVDPLGLDAIPVIFPDYRPALPKDWPIGGGTRPAAFGHAGIIIYDAKTGLTKYYEYGRYNNLEGECGCGAVRNLKIPDLIIGEDGKPTPESLEKLLKHISKASGHGGSVAGVHVPNANFNDMNKYAQQRIKDNSDPDRKPYSILSNNCGHFMYDVLEAGGVDDLPWVVNPTPTNMMDELEEEDYTPIKYSPNKKNKK